MPAWSASVPRGVPTELHLYTDLARARRELFNGLGVPEADGDGVVVRGYCDELDWYARELLRLPFRFEVRAPVELRQAVGRIARELAAQFA